MASVTFKTISIRRLPGMPRGISRLEDLSHRINIITGPNGAGKSSTARYIHKLLWPEPMAGQISGDARFAIGNDQWGAVTEGGVSSFQKEGIGATPAGLPAKEAKPAYMLALHDLVVAEDKELAGEIMRESIGGYDLGQASEKLGYSSSIKSARSGEHVEYRNALEEIRKLKRKQVQLKEEEEKLSDYQLELEKTTLARREEAFYALCRQYLKARESVQKLNTELSHFHASIEKVRDDDLEQFDRLEAAVSGAADASRDANAIISQAKETISLLKLPAEGVDETTMSVLERHVDEFGEVEKAITEENKNKTAYEARAREALRGIGGAVDEEAWQGIDLPAVHELERFLLDAYQVCGDAKTNHIKINALKEELSSLPEADTTKIIRGMGALQSWLKNDRSYFGVSKTWLFVLAASAIVAALAAWQLGWPAMLGGVVVVVLIAFAAHHYRPRPIEQSQAEEYAGTGLEPPVEWSSPAVLKQLEKLSEMLVEAKKRERLQQSLDDLEAARKAIAQQVESINKQHEEYRLKLHAVPGLPDMDTGNYAGLYHFMMRVKEWQEHHANAKASEARINALRDVHKSLQDHICNAFLLPGCKAADKYAEAKAGFDSLAKKVNERAKALNAISQQEIILHNNAQKKQDAEKQLSLLCERLGVAPGMRHEISRLVDLLPAFKKLQNDLGYEQRTYTASKQQLESHELFPGKRRELSSLDVELAEVKMKECADIYGGRDKLVEKINGIRLRVDGERQSAGMELAMHRLDRAGEDLQLMFEQNLAAVTGQLVHDELSLEVREKTMPEVFSRAKALFNRITRGHYDLLFDHSGDGAFMAFDHVLGRGKELDELSTGTRLQLLLAVRLAYIESKEAGLKLPLLADEVLANSDDVRAKAIVEALAEISRAGRQVFYFTARENEVANWLAVTKERDEAPAIHRLSDRGNEEAAKQVAGYELPEFTFYEAVPEPATLTHKEYGKKLMIPPFDPVNDNTGQLHLWYLTEDNTLLYNFLTKGVRFWGQLHSFIKHSGSIAGLEERTFEQMQQKVQLLGHFCELYQTGRSKQIDAQVLKASNAINKSFIERVGDKLRELNGDPAALISALEAGEVPRFRASNIEELKSFFIEEGYIDSRDAYSDEDIRLRMRAYQSQPGIRPDDTERFMDLIRNHRA